MSDAPFSAEDSSAASTGAVADAAALAAALRKAADAVVALPRTLESELIASRGELPIEVIHGAERQWEAWARFASAARPVAPINLYPNLDVVRRHITPDIAEKVAPYRVAGEFAPAMRPRAIVGAESISTPEDHDVVAKLIAAGMEIRLLREVESWVYADAGILSAMPLNWGEHPPESIIVVRDPAVSSTIAALLEPMWRSAVPYAGAGGDALETLRLAGLGLTDRAIAAAQGISYRTVQRRFTEAMEQYDVRSRFALGAAWAATPVDLLGAGEQVDPAAGLRLE